VSPLFQQCFPPRVFSSLFTLCPPFFPSLSVFCLCLFAPILTLQIRRPPSDFPELFEPLPISHFATDILSIHLANFPDEQRDLFSVSLSFCTSFHLPRFVDSLCQ
jgi:hypothetical protein